MPSAIRESAGVRNILVAFEAPGETVTSGEASLPWTQLGTGWMSMRGLSGTTRAGLEAEAVYEFRGNYRADVTSRCRLHVGSRVFQITVPPMDPDGLNVDMVIVAQELLA